MSPRRRIDAGADGVLQLPADRDRWRTLTRAAAVAAAVVLVALAVSAMTFAHSQSERRAMVKQAAVLSFVRSFVSQYTSLDPFNANAYAERVEKFATGEFAKMYKDKMNEVVVAVARAEPSTGKVDELGIQRWNDDGSADVVVVADMTTTLPDGKRIQNSTRWLVTAIKEGDQWKVSNLIQVI